MLKFFIYIISASEITEPEHSSSTCYSEILNAKHQYAPHFPSWSLIFAIATAALEIYTIPPLLSLHSKVNFQLLWYLSFASLISFSITLKFWYKQILNIFKEVFPLDSKTFWNITFPKPLHFVRWGILHLDYSQQ